MHTQHTPTDNELIAQARELRDSGRLQGWFVDGRPITNLEMYGQLRLSAWERKRKDIVRD